ncbi:unnamed protein product [Closterium sp. Naga37s-1]|nr:unnamed protein product [Closterium sp. Naga37s-1]
MQLRPVNPADGFCAMGYYPGFAPANALPAALGLEGMGVVAALGEAAAQSAPDLAVGRRVVPLLALGALEAGSGAWQEYVAVDAAHVAAVPEGVRDEDAAQLAVNPLTVLGMLNQLDVPKGEYLVQTQAGSTLGRMLIQVARARGIRTINVVRRAAQAAELKALGGDEVICSTDESVPDRVRAITGGRMAHAAVESVAGDLTGAVLSSVRPGGTVLLFGGASGATFSASIGDFIFRDVTLKGFWVGPYLKVLSHERRQAVVKEAFDLIANGTVTPFTGDKMDLSEFATALKNQLAENRQGKILLSGAAAMRNARPESLEVPRMDERLSATWRSEWKPRGYNDHVALIRADLDRSLTAASTLVFRTIVGSILVSSFCIFTNRGGLATRTPNLLLHANRCSAQPGTRSASLLSAHYSPHVCAHRPCLQVHLQASVEDPYELSLFLHVPLLAGTVNRGSVVVSTGPVANDWAASAWFETTATELSVIGWVFKQRDSVALSVVHEMRASLIDALV